MHKSKRPTSKKKIAANRQNGKKSRGPITQAGKARSSENRIVHGLCGKFIVLPSESQEQYNQLLQSFMDAEKPVDAVEQELVVKMARHTWMSQRAIRFQDGCIMHHAKTEHDVAEQKQTLEISPNIEKFLRYQAAQDRAYARAAAELAKRRKERQLEKRGFESQKRAEAQDVRREKQQNQRDQMFAIKQETAQVDLELKKLRFLRQIDGLGAPQMAKMVA